MFTYKFRLTFVNSDNIIRSASESGCTREYNIKKLNGIVNFLLKMLFSYFILSLTL